MISYEEALEVVLRAVRKAPAETMVTEDALGLVLARAVKAPMQMPRQDQSAMDGIAVRIEDVAGAGPARPVELALIDEIPAGSPRHPSLRPGTAIKVFTGSGIPRNCGGVVMVEDCRFAGNLVEVRAAAVPGQHVRRAGEEVARGDLLARPGDRLTPPLIGLLSLFGVDEVRVIVPPVVGVITMGDELASPGEKPGPSRIHDANGPALRAALRGLGVRKIRSWKAGDRPAELAGALRSALASCGVVITCGGASVGDHDHVAAARERVGIRDAFTRIAIKPGKPNVFGLGPGRVPVFSLPGNPVSALVSFHQVVRPALLEIMGREPDPGALSRTLSAPCRHRPGRLEWVRARLDANGTGVTPTAAQGSHMLTGLAHADALVELPSSCGAFDPGEPVTVRRLNWTG